MLIGKMNIDWKETSREAIRDHKKVLIEILSRLSNLEASAKRLVEDQRSQKEKNGTNGRPIPPLLMLCPPHGNHSRRPEQKTSLYQEDVHGGAEEGERGKKGRRRKPSHPLGLA